MDQLRRRTALAAFALGIAGWGVLLLTGGPTGSEAIELAGPIAFDPMWALVGVTGALLASGAAGLLKPFVID